MSTMETEHSHLKSELNQKPQIPSKPRNSTSDSTLMDNNIPGKKKVFEIVCKFNQSEVFPPSGRPAAPKKKGKRAPTIKPKPKEVHLLRSTQAPPLPLKRRQSQRMAAVVKEDPFTLDVRDGSQLAHNGKEVKQQKVRYTSLSEPQCERNCTCVCHLHRPGMKLVWVQISESEQDDKDETNAREDEEEEGSETDEDEDEEGEEDEMEKLDLYQFGSSESDGSENIAPLSNKERFQTTLNIIEGQLRRKSDPGPESILNCFRSMPQPQSHLTKAHSASEEESIYEATLDLIIPSNKNISTPIIQVNKFPKSPPVIPPRMPLDRNRGRHVIQKKPVPPTLVPLPSPKLLPVNQIPIESLHPQRPPPTPVKARSLNNVSQTSKDDGEGEEEKKERQSGLNRKKSIDLEAHMPADLLYQIYTETYISKEIRRQTVCRNISKTSADYNMDPRVSTGSGAGGPRCSPIPARKRITLWQDLPDVRDSGILETLTPEECKYQESMYEVLTSEVSYLLSLRVLTEHFMESRGLNETLINRDKKTLFSNILRIREVSEKFLKDLEERLEQSVRLTNICNIISYHAQHNFPAYIDYVRNQIYQDKTYTSLMRTNVQFATVIAFLQDSPICQRLPFTSFLLLPFQRITRIKILIENILKRTAEGTQDEEIASKALAAVSKIINDCNTEVGKMKQMEELIQINNILEFDKLKAVPIISQNRFLEKQGELQEIAKGGTLFNLKPKFSPVYLYLFNDLLVLANKKSSERYMVIDHAHRSLVQAQREETINQSTENCFCLTLLENHQGRMLERLLKAPSESDMHRWLAAFPNPEDPNRVQEEVVYEDWDCPQVQCVEQYVATQADELNLEPPEIINVTRKTNEGWYEGSRLSDGQKGWFPVKNVVEITSEHMRRRNLRERYRVMQAASALTNKTRTAS